MSDTDERKRMKLIVHASPVMLDALKKTQKAIAEGLEPQVHTTNWAPGVVMSPSTASSLLRRGLIEVTVHPGSRSLQLRIALTVEGALIASD